MIGKHFGPPLPGLQGERSALMRARGYDTISSTSWTVADLVDGLEPWQLASAPDWVFPPEPEPESLT
jgi:hypothetical protein